MRLQLRVYEKETEVALVASCHCFRDALGERKDLDCSLFPLHMLTDGRTLPAQSPGVVMSHRCCLPTMRGCELLPLSLQTPRVVRRYLCSHHVFWGHA